MSVRKNNLFPSTNRLWRLLRWWSKQPGWVSLLKNKSHSWVTETEMSNKSPSQAMDRTHTSRHIYRAVENQTDIISSGNTRTQSFPFLLRDSGQKAPFSIEADRGDQWHIKNIHEAAVHLYSQWHYHEAALCDTPVKSFAQILGLRWRFGVSPAELKNQMPWLGPTWLRLTILQQHPTSIYYLSLLILCRVPGGWDKPSGQRLSPVDRMPFITGLTHKPLSHWG